MTQRTCDCVLSQNGLGMSGRECNCPAFTLPPTGDAGELVMKARHRKRGIIYTIEGSAHLQTDTPLSDMAELIVYRCDHDGSLWVRPTAEFNDGRFDLLEEPTAANAEPQG